MGTRRHDSITPEQRLDAERSLAELGVSEEVLECASLVVIGIRSGSVGFGDLHKPLTETMRRRAQQRESSRRRELRREEGLRHLLEARTKDSPTTEEADALAEEVLSLYPDAVVARSLDDVARLFLRARDYRDDAYDAVWGRGGCVLLKFWNDRP